MSSAPIQALAASIARLDTLTANLTADDLALASYASEWTIGDVLSHLGSGAQIMCETLQARLEGRELDQQHHRHIWDVWNAKTDTDRARDRYEHDHRLLDRLASVPTEQHRQLRFRMGPMDLDFGTFVGMRLNEHVVHTWDIDVATDPAATLLAGAIPHILEHLAMIAGFAGRPDGTERDLTIATTNPTRQFQLTTTVTTITLTQLDAATTPEPAGDVTTEVTVEAEALIRLVYGRLNNTSGPHPLHHLDALFPGF